ncbi:hypothetical protein LPJ66_006677, partial [Kickxella alabastrina]
MTLSSPHVARYRLPGDHARSQTSDSWPVSRRKGRHVSVPSPCMLPRAASWSFSQISTTMSSAPDARYWPCPCENRTQSTAPLCD